MLGLTLGELRSYKLGRRSLYSGTPMSAALTREEITRQRDINYNTEVLLATDGVCVKSVDEVVDNAGTYNVRDDLQVVKTRELYRTSKLSLSDFHVANSNKTRRIINTVDSTEFTMYYNDIRRITESEDGTVYKEVEEVRQPRVTDEINGVLRVPKVIIKDYTSKMV